MLIKSIDVIPVGIGFRRAHAMRGAGYEVRGLNRKL